MSQTSDGEAEYDFSQEEGRDTEPLVQQEKDEEAQSEPHLTTPVDSSFSASDETCIDIEELEAMSQEATEPMDMSMSDEEQREADADAGFPASSPETREEEAAADGPSPIGGGGQEGEIVLNSPYVLGKGAMDPLGRGGVILFARIARPVLVSSLETYLSPSGELLTLPENASLDDVTIMVKSNVKGKPEYAATTEEQRYIIDFVGRDDLNRCETCIIVCDMGLERSRTDWTWLYHNTLLRQQAQQGICVPFQNSLRVRLPGDGPDVRLTLPPAEFLEWRRSRVLWDENALPGEICDLEGHEGPLVVLQRGAVFAPEVQQECLDAVAKSKTPGDGKKARSRASPTSYEEALCRKALHTELWVLVPLDTFLRRARHAEAEDEAGTAASFMDCDELVYAVSVGPDQVVHLPCVGRDTPKPPLKLWDAIATSAQGTGKNRVQFKQGDLPRFTVKLSVASEEGVLALECLVPHFPPFYNDARLTRAQRKRDTSARKKLENGAQKEPKSGAHAKKSRKPEQEEHHASGDELPEHEDSRASRDSNATVSADESDYATLSEAEGSSRSRTQPPKKKTSTTAKKADAESSPKATKKKTKDKTRKNKAEEAEQTKKRQGGIQGGDKDSQPPSKEPSASKSSRHKQEGQRGDTAEAPKTSSRSRSRDKVPHETRAEKHPPPEPKSTESTTHSAAEQDPRPRKRNPPPSPPPPPPPPSSRRREEEEESEGEQRTEIASRPFSSSSSSSSPAKDRTHHKRGSKDAKKGQATPCEGVVQGGAGEKEPSPNPPLAATDHRQPTGAAAWEETRLPLFAAAATQTPRHREPQSKKRTYGEMESQDSSSAVAALARCWQGAEGTYGGAALMSLDLMCLLAQAAHAQARRCVSSSPNTNLDLVLETLWCMGCSPRLMVSEASWPCALVERVWVHVSWAFVVSRDPKAFFQAVEALQEQWWCNSFVEACLLLCSSLQQLLLQRGLTDSQGRTGTCSEEGIVSAEAVWDRVSALASPRGARAEPQEIFSLLLLRERVVYCPHVPSTRTLAALGTLELSAALDAWMCCREYSSQVVPAFGAWDTRIKPDPEGTLGPSPVLLAVHTLMSRFVL